MVSKDLLYRVKKYFDFFILFRVQINFTSFDYVSLNLLVNFFDLFHFINFENFLFYNLIYFQNSNNFFRHLKFHYQLNLYFKYFSFLFFHFYLHH